MITDPRPRAAPHLREYTRSDTLTALALPPADLLRPATATLFETIRAEDPRAVRRASRDLLDVVGAALAAPPMEVRVLGTRPHGLEEDGTCTYQLYGDYTPSSRRIRIWLRTAIRDKVCSPKAFLATLLHEACHHLDCTTLGLPESYHTRGFFQRVDDLYHHALGTPAEERRPLIWTQRGPTWRIDWARTRGHARR